jgi:hypothetical protein
MDDLYEEEEEAYDELRRLQELTEIGDANKNNDDEVEVEEEEEEYDFNKKVRNRIEVRIEDVVDINELVEIPLVLGEEWKWSKNQCERLSATSKFIRLICSALNKVNKACEEILVAARKNRAEAGAQAFRQARIVGATVVGASRRLEALRAAEPFAVVVEEACEVIEPTLMSVLAVNSLRKLELIGDHRQLPAFIQQCWYNFETTLPSLKTSLFERLIEGSVSSKARHEKKAK